MAPLGTVLVAAGAANLAARGFSYHDNGVRFISENGDIQSGSFKVTAFAISAGQDPQGKNHVGDVHTTRTLDPPGNGDVFYGTDPGPAYPGFIFTAGRHKTSEIADFWTARIPAGRTSFNHDPGALNFAFIGDMNLTTAACGPLHFAAIGLAQGSDAHGSNWWFGGEGCSYTGSNQVYCIGTRPEGTRLGVTFQRGGKGLVQDVYINRCEYLDYH